MPELANIDVSRLEANAAAAAGLLRALANESRLMVLCQLASGEQSVGGLLAGVTLSQSALSQHLAVLRHQGLVATRREGQTIWYRIADPAALEVVATLAGIFCPQDAHGGRAAAPVCR